MPEDPSTLRTKRLKRGAFILQATVFGVGVAGTAWALWHKQPQEIPSVFLGTALMFSFVTLYSRVQLQRMTMTKFIVVAQILIVVFVITAILMGRATR